MIRRRKKTDSISWDLHDWLGRSAVGNAIFGILSLLLPIHLVRNIKNIVICNLVFFHVECSSTAPTERTMKHDRITYVREATSNQKALFYYCGSPSAAKMMKVIFAILHY